MFLCLLLSEILVLFLKKDDVNYSELVQDYDYAKYLLSLTKEQRSNFGLLSINLIMQ